MPTSSADNTPADDTLTDHALAADLAKRAGDLLLALARREPPGAQRGKLGDRQSDDFLIEALRRLRPADGLLSEETADSPDRLAKARVWIIDPLDGTREYTEADRVDWAVHVALAVDGLAMVGAVALPAAGIVLCTGSPPVVPHPAQGQPLRLVVSRTRAPQLTSDVAKLLGAELIPMGSAGAKAMAVVLGRADAYVHAGGMYEWDSCAPVAVAAAAGLHVSRLDGSPLRYNQGDSWQPDLVLCRRQIAPRLLAAIAAVG